MIRQLVRSVLYLLVGVMIAPATNASPGSFTTYQVTALFAEPQTTIGETRFQGTFKWDPVNEVVTDLQGTLNEVMYDPSEYPDLNLNYQLVQNVNGNLVTATVFKENTTDTFWGGGYQAGGMIKYGGINFGQGWDGNEPNENAYFTLAFDKTTLQGIVDELVYADCSPGGLMGPFCMTGHSVAKVGYIGTMNAFPTSITISAVPLPAAVWLFGSALVGLFSISRKQLSAVGRC